MIEVKKGPEPKGLLQYRLTSHATYAAMPSALKQEIIQSLLSEQGYICAYCMKRVEAGYGKHRATIEHCIPQASSNESERLNYRNMLAVCRGNRDASSINDKTCDARRGSLPLEEQSMKKVNVFNGNTLSSIAYRSDGTIYSQDPDVNEDLNKRLNLNCLKGCRLAALQALQREITRHYSGKTVSRDYLQKLLAHYQEPNVPKTPYCGILISWLRRKLGLSA